LRRAGGLTNGASAALLCGTVGCPIAAVVTPDCGGGQTAGHGGSTECGTGRWR